MPRRPLCLAALLVTGLLWVLLSIVGLPEDPYASMDEQTLCCTGIVVSKEYKQGADSMTLLVTINHIQDTSIHLSIRDRDSVLVRIPLDADNDASVLAGDEYRKARADAIVAAQEAMDRDVRIGSRIRVTGTLAPLQAATNHGAFNGYLYYRTLGYVFQIRQAQVETVAEAGAASALDNALYAVRSRLRSVLYASCIKETDADILAAMLLGEKGWLDTGIKDLYQSAGIIHILAISGLHIAIIGMGCCRMLERLRLGHRYLPRQVSALLSVMLMLLYGRMTGMTASSARAIIMFLLRIVARQIHRTYDLLSALCVAGMLILLEQPLYLYNAGFQFSFGAVLSIGLLTPILPADILQVGEKRLLRRLELRIGDRIGRWSGRRRRVPLPSLSLQGLAVTIGTFPVNLMAYGTVSVYAVFLNALVLPLMSLVMLSGLLVLGLGLISRWLGWLAAWPLSYLLHFYLLLCEIAGALPGHTAIPGHPETGMVAIFLLLIAVLLYLFHRYPVTHFHVLLWLVAAMQLLTWHDVSGLRIHVMDVGQGDGIYIACDGANILVDGGSTSSSDVARYQLEPLLEYYGAETIDLAVMTHEDADHMNGLLELLEGQQETGIRIRRLAMPDVDISARGENYLAVQAAAVAAGTEIVYLHQGSTLTTGKLTMTCLGPVAGTDAEEPNETSVVLYLTYGSFTGLLTGDLEGAGEESCLTYMASRSDLFPLSADGDPGTADSVTFLKAAHHGSRGATTEAFLAAVRPRYAVISCGRNNWYGHPHQETLDRLEDAGAAIYDTRYDGEITFLTDGNTLRIESYVNTR